MDHEGPPLELLLRRIGEAPQDFLVAPALGGSPGVHVPAVVHDLLALLGTRVNAPQLQAFYGGNERAWKVTLLLCWLLADEWFRAFRPDGKAVLELLKDDTAQLVQQTAPEKFLHDPERREELARLALARLGLRPAGESKAQAQDRFTSLSALERAKVLKAARAAEERARAIREALARKAAEESADKWTRE